MSIWHYTVNIFILIKFFKYVSELLKHTKKINLWMWGLNCICQNCFLVLANKICSFLCCICWCFHLLNHPTRYELHRGVCMFGGVQHLFPGTVLCGRHSPGTASHGTVGGHCLVCYSCNTLLQENIHRNMRTAGSVLCKIHCVNIYECTYRILLITPWLSTATSVEICIIRFEVWGSYIYILIVLQLISRYVCFCPFWHSIYIWINLCGA